MRTYLVLAAAALASARQGCHVPATGYSPFGNTRFGKC
jgi:hypothetical protein